MAVTHADVVIIGAGVVGAALARELSRYNLEVILVEKEADVSGGASKANSGIVHSGIHDHPGTLKADLCVKGNRLFHTLAAELDLLYKTNGSIIVARSGAELSALDVLYTTGLTNGVTDLSFLKPTELLHLEPGLAPTLAGGLLAPSAGIVVPFDLVFGLVENAMANGIRVRLNSEVRQITVEKPGFIVETTGGVFKTSYLVNAAGIYSAAIAALIGDDSFAINPVKGEEFLLDRRLEGLVRRTIFPAPNEISKGILVIPTVDGNIMIGPTAHAGASWSDLSTSAAGWEEVYTEVKTLLPSLQQRDLITSFAGLRANSDRDDFIIESSPVAPRFINIAGIKSPGLTAAPAIAVYVKELLSSVGLKLKPKPHFHPERRVIRLRQMNSEQQARLMAGNPAFANIVCRCELVSEGEVREAIRRGATTVDGVKLRTRAGMGRCQGGFCTAKIIKLLSEELKIPPELVTKKGPGSHLLFGKLRCREDCKNDAGNFS